MTDQNQPPVSAEKLARIMRQVQAMLDKAESTEFEPEAKAFRAKAEELMRTYRIEEEHLIAEDQTSVKPEWLEIDFHSRQPKFQQAYVNLIYSIAHHAGVRIRTASFWNADANRRVVRAYVCGYSGDLRMTEWIFTAARLAFAEALEPEINPELSDQVNVYRLRKAGIERNRIANLLWGSAMTDGSAHGKVAKLYKAECAARGEDAAVTGRNINAKTYREAYADAFENRLWRRLRQARDAADSTGGALVLHGRAERVDEAFYERFPELRPSTDVAERKPCEACSKTKHESGKCRDHRPYRPTQAEIRAYHRRTSSDAAIAGGGAGIEAAEKVELTRPARARRLEEGPEGAVERTVNEILELGK